MISDAVAVRREELRAMAGCVTRKLQFADAFEFVGASVSARFLTACGNVALQDDDPRSCVDENQMSSVVGVFVLLWDFSFCLGSGRNFCSKFIAFYRLARQHAFVTFDNVWAEGHYSFSFMLELVELLIFRKWHCSCDNDNDHCIARQDVDIEEEIARLGLIDDNLTAANLTIARRDERIRRSLHAHPQPSGFQVTADDFACSATFMTDEELDAAEAYVAIDTSREDVNNVHV